MWKLEYDKKTGKILNIFEESQEEIENDFIVISDDKRKSISTTRNGFDWLYINNEFVLTDMRTTEEKINKKRKELANTDWVISKINEYKLYGEDLTDKYSEELAERRKLREEINDLEKKLG